MNKKRQVDNFDALRCIFAEASGKLGRHLDVGHGKDLKFPVKMAKNIPGSEIVYFDTSDFIMRLKREYADRIRGRKRIKEYDEFSFPQNLIFTSAPEGPFDSATCFFTIHEAPSPLEIFKQIYGLLRDGGRVYVIDYDLAWVRDRPNPRETLAGIFNTKNEKKVILTEPDWFESHTKYSLENCIADAENSGFTSINSAYAGLRTFLGINEEDNQRYLSASGEKLFAYIGKK
jgi:SAM-dependent methyltransferase